MHPLSSINWQGIDSAYDAVGVVLTELRLLRVEMMHSGWELEDFSQLDRNITHIKMGLERAERIFLDSSR